MNDKLKPLIPPQGTQLLGPNVEGFTVAEWCPTSDGTGKPTAVAVDMSQRVEHEFTVVRDGKTVTLTAKASGYYWGGSWGLPEHSAPAEGEVEELELFDEDDKPWTGTLTEEEDDKLNDKLMELIMEAYDGGDD